MRVFTMMVGLLLVGAAVATAPEDPRLDAQHGVLVEMTLLEPAAAMGRDSLTWEVRLETHSGDLRPLDLAPRARLHAADGTELGGTFTFDVTADSAHHPAGLLTLHPSEEAGTLLREHGDEGGEVSFYVSLHDVAGAAERRFAWSLPVTGEAGVWRAYVANAGDGTISVIDLEALAEIDRWSIGEEASHGLAVLPDGGTVYAGTGAEGAVVALDARDGTVQRRIERGVNAHGIDRTPDGRYVFVGAGGTNETAHLLRIDTRTGATTDLRDGLDPVGHIDVSPDGRRVYVANLGTNGLTVLDTETLTTVAVIEVGEGPNESRVSPDGKTVFVANWISSDVSVVDTDTLRVTNTLTVGEGTHGVAITPDGNDVWIVNRISNDVAIVDARTLRTVDRLTAGEYANHVSFTPDGRLALVTNARGNELTVFDAKARTVLATIPVGTEPHEIAIGPTPSAGSTTTRTGSR